MALEHVLAVAEASESKSADRHVLSVIASRMHFRSHVSWPSISTIARECGCSTRHVKNAIPRLEALGELIVRRGASDKSTHVYALGPKLQRVALHLAVGKKGMNVIRDGGAHGSIKGEQRARELVNGVHPNPNSSMETISPGAEAQEKTNAEGLALKLREAGIKNARTTEQLVQAARLGANLADVLAAIQDARSKAGDPFAYGVRVILNRLQLSSSPPSGEEGWKDARRSFVEDLGEKTGVGKWDEVEHWAKYKARVASAAHERDSAQCPQHPP